MMLAALPGAFLMGFGHFYALRIKRGLFFMLAGLTAEMLFFVAFFGAFFSASLILTIMFGIIWLALWVWQIRDSDALVKKYNAMLENAGHPP